jgi:outer membrane protein assembly factor BamB
LPDSNPTVDVVTGALYAFDAVTLAPLWNSRENATRDDIGEYAKLVPPTVVNGHVYLATGSQDVLVYGLLPSTP